MSAGASEARPDFEAEGLLDGLGDRPRRARRRLLERLFDAGYTLAELKEAVIGDRLVVLPAERALSGEARYSARELSSRTGLPLEYLQSVFRAAGLAADDPDERAYDEDGLERAGIIAGFYEIGLDPEAMLEVTRVLGRGLSQTADAMGELFGETFIKAGVTEEEIGLRNAEAAGEWLPRVTPLLGYLLKRHMRERLRHQAVSQAMLEAGELPGTRDVAVAFADLVAFTSVEERQSTEAVGRIAGRLGELASECATPPVRLVKTIGDAAMLVAPAPEQLLRSTFDLLDAVERAGQDFPRLRVGASWGPALNRSGDWYGRTVNLASRITDVAEPGTVIATRELSEATAQLCAWSPLGAREFKGIADAVELFQADR